MMGGGTMGSLVLLIGESLFCVQFSQDGGSLHDGWDLVYISVVACLV